MISFTTRFVQVYILLFVMAAGVAGAPLPDLERRVLTSAGRAVARTAIRGARSGTFRAAARPMRMPPIPPAAPQAAKSSTGSTLAQSIFATKIATGILVAGGMHGATAADNKLAGEKRELLEDTLFEKRTLSAAQQAARTAARSVARVASRPAARPQVLARPIFKPAVPPAAAPKAPSTFANNAKKVGKFTAMGLTGGVGEYFGGRTMSNMLENLDKHEKRSLAEDDEELYARNPPLRSIARVGGTVMRTAARRGGNGVNTVAHSLPRPVPPQPAVAKKGFGNTKLFSAIFAGAAVENGLQTLTPEAAEKIKHDPKGTIAKMVKGPVFGRPAGDKRELGDDEDLAARDATISGFDR